AHSVSLRRTESVCEGELTASTERPLREEKGARKSAQRNEGRECTQRTAQLRQACNMRRFPHVHVVHEVLVAHAKRQKAPVPQVQGGAPALVVARSHKSSNCTAAETTRQLQMRGNAGQPHQTHLHLSRRACSHCCCAPRLQLGP